jgi:hypothetical protein
MFPSILQVPERHPRPRLNEADLMAVRVADDGSEATVALRMLTLSREGPEPKDRMRHLRCRPIGRVAASLRHGRREDKSALVASDHGFAARRNPSDPSPTQARVFGTARDTLVRALL